MGEPRGRPRVKIRKNMSSFHRQSSQRIEQMQKRTNERTAACGACTRFSAPPAPASCYLTATALPLFLSSPCALPSPTPSPPPLSLSPSLSLSLFFFPPLPRVSAADAVIVRCSSRCIVVRNNDFIKIHARGHDDTIGGERERVNSRAGRTGRRRERESGLENRRDVRATFFYEL